jgi:hypothetical protein
MARILVSNGPYIPRAKVDAVVAMAVAPQLLPVRPRADLVLVKNTKKAKVGATKEARHRNNELLALRRLYV